MTELDDRRIAAALDRGDIEAAAMLAAKIADPRGYLKAMETVNRYMNEEKQRMFELSKQSASLSNFNPRVEIHGNETEPAADIKFEVNVESGLLAMFAPTLRWALFHKEGDGGDLVNQAHEAPNLRFPKMGPIKWDAEIVGATVTIAHGIGGASDIVLGANVNAFVLAPQEGGTVIVTFRVQCHPDERQAGKLCMLQGETVELTIEAPEPLPAATTTE